MNRVLMVVLMMAGSTVPLWASDRDVVIASCKSQLRMSNTQCDCIAGKYEALAPKQQKVFLAIIKEDRAAMVKLQGEMTVAEMTAVGTAMEKMPAECAG